MNKTYLKRLMGVLCMLIISFGSIAQNTTPLPPPLAALGTYQMNRGSQRLQGTQYMKGNFTAAAVVKWKATLTVNNGGGEAEPAIGDIDGDGKNDIVCSINNGDLMVFDGVTGAIKWTKNGAGGQTSAVIADADADGQMDLAICNATMTLRDNLGNVKWSYTPPNVKAGGISSCPNVSDLDGDGLPEVVFINNNVCYALNGLNGIIKWQYSIGPPSTYVAYSWNGTGPAIGDLNNDDNPDVVALLMNGAGTTLAAIDGKTGTAIWTKAGAAPFGFSYPFPAIGDLDGDCKLDVVFNGGALNGQTGNAIWGNITAAGGAKFMVLADVDDDCIVEAVTACGVYNAKTGVAKWIRPSCSLSGWFAPAPKVGDFNPNSPGKEIVTNGAYNINTPLSLYNATTGALLWQFNMAAENHTSEGVSVADVDNDGCVEIVVMPDCCNGSNTLMILDDIGNTKNCGILASIDQVDFLHDSVSCKCQNFTDFSTKCTNQWNWSFPGGSPSSSTAKDPGQVCYNTPGTYNVTMIAQRNTCASMDTVIHSIVIGVCGTSLPIPLFTSSDTTFCFEGGACIDFFDHSTNNPTSWTWRFPGAQPDTSTMQNPTGICYYIPGTYPVTLIVTNSGGTDSLKVSSHIIFGSGAALPIITLKGDTLFCSHESAYQWYYNGLPIAGATDSFYVATQDGNYNVYIADDIGCSRLGNGINVTVTISVGDIPGDSQLSIYPNPAKGELWIMSPRLRVKEETIEIYNVLGERVHYSLHPSQSSQAATVIDISSLAKGVYVVELTAENKIYRAKLMKE